MGVLQLAISSEVINNWNSPGSAPGLGFDPHFGSLGTGLSIPPFSWRHRHSRQVLAKQADGFELISSG